MTETDNLKSGLTLWDKVSTPKHEYTKQFKRSGGFKGTSISVTAMAMMATEVFGPNGIGWGLIIEDEQYVSGHPFLSNDGTVLGHAIIHVVRAHIWYIVGTSKYETSSQFGQTTFVGKNKYGLFTDEEAPKKSISDAQNKCLSLLGFASDIFLGKWDDNKYLDEVKQYQDAEKKQQSFKRSEQSHADFVKNMETAISNCDTLEDLSGLSTANQVGMHAATENEQNKIKEMASKRRDIIKGQNNDQS